MDDPKLDLLRERLVELNEQSSAIFAAADAENRDTTAEEADQLDSIFASVAQTEAEIERRQKQLEQQQKLAKPQGRKVDPDTAPRRANITPVTTSIQKNRWGFDNFGDYLKAVRSSSAKGAQLDSRFVNAPTTVATEGVGPDGGFAVPPDFRATINQLIDGEDSLFARTDRITTSSNTFTVPVDIDTPWSGSGITAYWTAENAQQTQSKPVLREETLKLHKLVVLVPVTEELLEDSMGMESYVAGKAAQKINFELNRVIVIGTGAGQPLGLLNSGCKVSVAKQGSQVADTLVSYNVIDMWSRMYAPSRRNAIWLINQDIEPMLLTMSVAGKDATGAAATGYGALVYVPPGGLSDTPYGTLLGRPVVPTQACETLGDEGDIIFWDPSQYLTVTKSGGIRQAMSMHVWFDYDTTAFKFVIRVAGQPWWPTTISARDGSATYSPVVTLAARA